MAAAYTANLHGQAHLNMPNEGLIERLPLNRGPILQLLTIQGQLQVKQRSASHTRIVAQCHSRACHFDQHNHVTEKP